MPFDALILKTLPLFLGHIEGLNYRIICSFWLIGLGRLTTKNDHFWHGWVAKRNPAGGTQKGEDPDGLTALPNSLEMYSIAKLYRFSRFLTLPFNTDLKKKKILKSTLNEKLSKIVFFLLTLTTLLGLA